MAGALRKAGEAAAKLRRLGAAVSERSEFCRSSRSAAVLAVKLFSAPLGLLVLFGLRKERTPCYGSMFRIHAFHSGASYFGGWTGGLREWGEIPKFVGKYLETYLL